MEFDLTEKKIGIYGIQGSGKTELAKGLVRTYFKKPIVYTSNHDWDNEDVYLYRTDKPKADLRKFCEAMKEKARQGKISVIIFDDADLLFSSNMDIPLPLKDLHINHRHYKLALVFLSRRPQDIPTAIVESCHWLYILKCEGDNIRKKFNEVNRQIWELVEELKYKDYRFVVKKIGESPYIHDKIEMRK